MKKVLVWILSLAVMFTLLGCSKKTEATTLVWGLIPTEDPNVIIEEYTPIKDWLAKELGVKIELRTASDYTGVVEAMRGKKVDFAHFGPFSYVLASDRADAVAFAKYINEKGEGVYRSILQCTPEVALALSISIPLEGEEGMRILAEKFNEHKGDFTFAFTDPASTSGFAIPRYYMYKAGLNPDDTFKKVNYVGGHDASILGVKNKTLEIGATNDETYSKLLDKGQISEKTNIIIWISPDIPNDPLAYRKDLPEDLKEKLSNAITRVPENLLEKAHLKKYVRASDSEYDVIKDVKKILDEIG